MRATFLRTVLVAGAVLAVGAGCIPAPQPQQPATPVPAAAPQPAQQAPAQSAPAQAEEADAPWEPDAPMEATAAPEAAPAPALAEAAPAPAPEPVPAEPVPPTPEAAAAPEPAANEAATPAAEAPAPAAPEAPAPAATPAMTEPEPAKKQQGGLDIVPFTPATSNTRIGLTTRTDGSGYDISGNIGGLGPVDGKLDKKPDDMWHLYGKAVMPTAGYTIKLRVLGMDGGPVDGTRQTPITMIAMEVNSPPRDAAVAQAQTEVPFELEFKALTPTNFYLSPFVF